MRYMQITKITKVNCFCVRSAVSNSASNDDVAAALLDVDDVNDASHTDASNTVVGNPAAVVENFVGDKIHKQQLAKDLNFPVTVFVSPIDVAVDVAVATNLTKLSCAHTYANSSVYPNVYSHAHRRRVLLEFFYPHAEMPLCLHGALAAAKVLCDAASVSRFATSSDFADSVDSFEYVTSLGQQLNIVRRGHNIFYVEVSAQPLAALTMYKIDENLLCRMLRLTAFALEKDETSGETSREISEEINGENNMSMSAIIDKNLPCVVASVGSPKLLIPVRSLQLLAKLQPDYAAIAEWGSAQQINGLYVYTAETFCKTATFHARGFNPRTGHNEDAATGVAAAALALAVQQSIVVEQGNFIGKPCIIDATLISKERVLVGGEVVVTI